MHQPLRLNKFIAQSKHPELGKISRRGADRLISEGRVKVNGKVVNHLGIFVHPGRDHVRVDDVLIRLEQEHFYFILNKPKNIIVSKADDMGRQTVFDLLGKVGQRVVPVGRLDFNSEGLLLFSSDGWLVNRLTHPKYKVKKTYHVKVSGCLSQAQMDHFRNGLILDGRRTAPAIIEFLRTTGKNSWYKVIIHEGRQRQIRRMFETVNHNVLKLKRLLYGPISLKGLKPGQFRRLTEVEIKRLYEVVGR